MSNSIEQDFIIAWKGVSDEEVATHYERIDLEELFKQVYGFYPSSSLFKNKASIVKQLRDRGNILSRAAAFSHAGKSMPATPAHRMDLEALSVVEHTYSIT